MAVAPNIAPPRADVDHALAAVSALAPFFNPRSIAVIGASRERGTIAGEVLHNLLDYGFAGPVLPVNSRATVVQSVVAYPSVEEVSGPVDLAIVVVPARSVLEVARGCARKGVRALVVISSGFAETGAEGRELQTALMDICRSAGMRLIGPNCMGIVNTAETARVNATFAPIAPRAGRIGFMSQSGALGLAVMDHAESLGLGLSTFVSVGNKADISGNDLLCHWEQDPLTDVILLYLESFGNPRKFSRIARRVARSKPIVAVKSGRSPAGVRAAGSHTGAMLAASDVTVDALFHYAGVIRTDTLSEMFDVASLLASQPLPAGHRVAILTNAGGPGILCADACVGEGLEIPALSEATQARLRALLPPEAGVQNPVDMIASASAAQYRQAIEVLVTDESIDALVVIFIPPLVTRPEDVARAIVDGARSTQGTKPVLSVFMQSRGVPTELTSSDVHVPSYAFPENAAIALARVTRYAMWRARPSTAMPALGDVRRDDAKAIVANALARDNGWLTPGESRDLLACYGVPMLTQREVCTEDDAARVAAELGGLIALKAIAPTLVHKSDAGAVRLGLTPESVASAARAMAERVRAAGHIVNGFLVQGMAAPGVEMVIGVVHDPSFGPVVACGAGGVLVELLHDLAVRLAPVSATEAAEMLHELKTYPLLAGYRGAPAHDERAVADVITRLSVMADDLPEIAELDINPLIVHEQGVSVVDVRVRLLSLRF
ncbi:GNAT family N-acetyltransferase [soil metagenome]